MPTRATLPKVAIMERETYPEILNNCIHFDIRSVIAEWVLKLQSDGVSIKATAR